MGATEQKNKADKDIQNLLHKSIEKEAALLVDYLNSKLPKQTGKKDKFLQSINELFFNCLKENFLRLYGLYFPDEETDIKHLQQEIKVSDKGETFENYGFYSLVNYNNSVYTVKCIFKDNKKKPNTVTDVKLSLNIIESVFIRHAYYYQAIIECFVKDIISLKIIKQLDKIIDETDAKLIISAKIKNDLIKKIAGICAEIDTSDFSEIDITGKISVVIDNVRLSCFNSAVHKLTQMLEKSGLNFQYIDVIENGHNVIIGEYEDTDSEILPDENYKIHLRYLNKNNIQLERSSYNEQYEKLLSETSGFWDLIEVIYQDSKPVFKVTDYNDLLLKNKNRILKMIGNYNYSEEKLYENQMDFSLMRELMIKMKNNISSAEFIILENKLAALENKFLLHSEITNPNSVQSGLLIDLDITSIKRKKTSISLLSSVLNKFLEWVISPVKA